MRLGALFPLVLALGATIAPGIGARAQPTAITACRTISEPGSYELANALTSNGNCLIIAANYVSINLAGYNITTTAHGTGAAILASPSSPELSGIIVSGPGSITGPFMAGVDLSKAYNSIVDGLIVAVFGNGISVGGGIVRNNISIVDEGAGINASGVVTGNSASGKQGMFAGFGSAVSGNIVSGSRFGLSVQCLSNVTNNTVLSGGPIALIGSGCNDTNNVAP